MHRSVSCLHKFEKGSTASAVLSSSQLLSDVYEINSVVLVLF